MSGLQSWGTLAAAHHLFLFISNVDCDCRPQQLSSAEESVGQILQKLILRFFCTWVHLTHSKNHMECKELQIPSSKVFVDFIFYVTKIMHAEGQVTCYLVRKDLPEQTHKIPEGTLYPEYSRKLMLTPWKTAQQPNNPSSKLCQQEQESITGVVWRWQLEVEGNTALCCTKCYFKKVTCHQIYGWQWRALQVVVYRNVKNTIVSNQLKWCGWLIRFLKLLIT